MGLLVIVGGLPLLFLDVGNASPGAIDDGSGVGTVLHLAECLASRADVRRRLRLTISITSAEELGVMGAAAYARQYEQGLRAQAEAGGLHVLRLVASN